MVTAPPGSRLRRRIDDEMLAFLREERGRLEPEARPLLDELEALIAAGGKRLRPRFCVAGHLACGGTDDRPILRAAAALEILHTFALIHDDVMDASPMRRSRRSAFHALAELGAGGRADAKRFGVSAAILTGLLGFVLADRMLVGCGFAHDRLLVALDRYDAMRQRAIAGQFLDLTAALQGEATVEIVRRIAALKSGSYSVVDPLVIGASLAAASPEQVAVLESFGAPLGEAFQHADDILGVFGDPAVTGKDGLGDLREGKQTMLVATARELASPAEREVIQTHLGDPELAEADAERVRDVLRACGALEAVRALIADLTAEAKRALDARVLDQSAVEALGSLADEVTSRQA